jgi:TP901 family phage tail tape measure protein
MARGDIVVRLIGDTSDLERKFAGAAANIGTLGGKIQKAGQQFSTAGRSLTAGLTLPIVALGAGAIKTAVDFESSFAGVRKTVAATEPQFAKLAQGFRDLAKEIPINVNELNSIGEAAGALGIKTGDILAFTEVVAKMGVTTNLTSEQAATAFGQLGNVLKLSAGDFSRLGSSIVDLGNKGASTESEISELMLRLAGSGATVGLAADEIAGLAAAMANAGVNAEAGGTALSTTLQRMAREVEQGGPKLARFAEIAGMTSEQFATAFKDKPAEAFAAFADGLSQMQAAGGPVFTTLDTLGIKGKREVDTLLRLGSASMTVAETVDISTEAWRKNNALNVEAQKKFDTTASKVALLKNRFQDTLITLGTSLIPVFERAVPIVEAIAGAVERVVGIFSRLPAPLQTAIVVFAGLLAALGPILMIAGSIATGIGALMSLFATLAPLLGVVGAAFAAISVPVLVVIGVIAALIAIGIAVWKNWDKVSAVLKTIWEGIKTVAKAVFGFLKMLFLNFTPQGLIIKHWATIKATLGAIWNGIKVAARNVFGFLKNLFLNFTPLGQIIKNWDRIMAFFGSLPGKIRRLTAGMWDGIKDAFREAINWIIRGWNRLEFKVPQVKVGPLKFGGFTVGLPDIPTLDTGGIVSKPTLALLAANSRPEAVVPLGRPGVGAASSSTYHINVTVSAGANPAEVGRQIVSAIRAYEKRSGKTWRAA